MAKSILEYFAELPDPRMERTKLHQLGDILAIAIDGKTLRHSFDKANDKAAIHMVSAWAPAIAPNTPACAPRSICVSAQYNNLPE